jgi:ABC-type glycerol-3-phosphate transport system substrate-binding protein
MPHDKKQTSFAGSDVFVIPSQCKNPDEAAQLLKFIMSTDNQVDYCNTVGFIPAQKSAATNSVFSSDLVKKAFADAVKCGKYYVKSDKSSAITTIIKSEFQTALSNQKSIDQALQDIDKQINDALKQ